MKKEIVKYSETVLDNEILLNFMIGMNRKIYDKLNARLSTSEPDLNLCLSEAEVIETENPNQTAATHDLLDSLNAEVRNAASASPKAVGSTPMPSNPVHSKLLAPKSPVASSVPASNPALTPARSDDVEVTSEVPGSKPAQGLGSGKPAAYAKGKESSEIECKCNC